MKILAVETSCDETALALLAFTDQGGKTQYKVLAEELYSQADLHSGYGGVFPTLAKREHQKILPVLTKKMLHTMSLEYTDPSVRMTDAIRETCSREPALLTALETQFVGIRPSGIDALAVTRGPGLAPALWVGVNFVRALSLLWDIPIIPVNHMEGHIVSALIADDMLITPEYPLIALLVSGGHTELVLAGKPGLYQKIGQTVDDAAGEAFDKVARLLSLPYPGGPEIARLARIARKKELRPPTLLPRPMLQEPSFDFSYAGLKTAVRVLCEKHYPDTDDEKAAIAMEFEDAVIETLTEKTTRAIEHYTPRTVVLGGGVSANTQLRTSLQRLTDKYPNTSLYLSDLRYATDNAFMIALTAYRHREHTAAAQDLSADANLSFSHSAP